MDWDPVWQGEGRGREKPLEPEASMTMSLPHVVGGPLPDRAEIIAGIWADGETFGDPKRLKELQDNRNSLATAYQQAISLLQQGLDQNWSRDQFLSALNGKTNSLPIDSMRRTLEASANLDEASRSWQRTMQGLLTHFTQNLGLLRQAKPPASIMTNP